MLSTLLSTLITCAAALAVGQGILRVCGWPRWSWISAPVGISALMVLSAPALHVPGRAWTTFLVIVALSAAMVVVMVREPAQRPPVAGLLAGLGPLLLALVPFAVAGRSGTLGVSIANDMSVHLPLADAHRTPALLDATRSIVGPGYPLGPHAVVGTIAEPLGLATDQAFAGFTIALVVILGWTGLALVRRAGALAQVAVVLLASMGYLIAALYGEASFKEIILASITLGMAQLLAVHGRTSSRLRWVPFAVLVAGVISDYSYQGLAWPLAFLATWLLVLAVAEVARGGAARRIGATVRAELVPIAFAAALALVVLIPQLPRVWRFAKASGGGTGLTDDALGNLVARLPFWEGLGVWDNDDFRFPAHDALATGALAGAILLLALWSASRWLRRGEWVVPTLAVVCGLLWLWVDRTQAPYVAPKALAVFTPFVLLVAARPLLEADDWGRLSALSWRPGAGLVAAGLVLAVVSSSWGALRHSQVGPRDHAAELRALRPHLHGRPTLFLGNDDFIRWELEGAPVLAPYIGSPGVPTRPEKGWQYGQAFDFDSVAPEVYAQVEYVIATRDAAASAPPAQLRLVRTTRDFALYRRVGQVEQRGLLPEGEGPGAVLDCRRDKAMRRLSRLDGTAAIRPGGVAVGVGALNAGADRPVDLELPAGRWNLVMAYTSALPVRVDGGGISTTMVPNLDRPGPRYPVGTITVAGEGTRTVRLRLRVPGHPLSSSAAAAVVTALLAVPAEADRSVPLERACGKYVDYFTLRATR